MKKQSSNIISSPSGAFIISGSKKNFDQAAETILGQWQLKKENNPDLVILSEDSIGIEQIRLLKKFFGQKKWSKEKKRVVLIPQGEGLSQESQNALLKTMEELKPGNYIIIGALSPHRLLSTIVSRCQIISQGRAISSVKKAAIDLEKLSSLAVEKRLVWLEKEFKPDRLSQAELERLLQEELVFYQKKLQQQDQAKKLAQLKKWLVLLDQAMKMNQANIKPFFVLDWLLLNL